MKLAERKVLVTGAAGFIGSHLAERLVREGCRVVALTHYDSRPDRANLEYVDPAILSEMDIRAGDIRDPSFVMGLVKGCDVVFHLAALIAIPYSYMAPASYVATNVQGTLNVLEASKANEVVRLVHTSTSECYGTARYVPIDEAHPLQAQSPYAASKIAADKLAESYHCSFGLPVTIIRPFNTFGPRQSARAVIPTVLSQLLAGVPVLRLGALDPIRDMNYVGDTVEGYVAVAQCDDAIGGVFNIGSGRGVTISEVATLCMTVVGRSVPIYCDEVRLRPSSSEVYSLVCDARRLKQMTGWQPRVDLEGGLLETARFIHDHPESYKYSGYMR